MTIFHQNQLNTGNPAFFLKCTKQKNNHKKHNQCYNHIQFLPISLCFLLWQLWWWSFNNKISFDQFHTTTAPIGISSNSLEWQQILYAIEANSSGIDMYFLACCLFNTTWSCTAAGQNRMNALSNQPCLGCWCSCNCCCYYYCEMLVVSKKGVSKTKRLYLICKKRAERTEKQWKFVDATDEKSHKIAS